MPTDKASKTSKTFGTKHLVECRCMLPQFKDAKNIVFHQFIVFSELINDTVTPKFVQCPNCGIVHNVYDLCKSEIVEGYELSTALLTVDDVRQSLPENISKLLSTYELPLHVWEEVLYVIQTGKWGSNIELTSERIKDTKHIKYLHILSPHKFSVKTEAFSCYVSPG